MAKSPAKSAKSAARNERLAVALRENLKRRKAQARQLARQRDTDKTQAGGKENETGERAGDQKPEFRRNHAAQ